jgi:hypothetical protein
MIERQRERPRLSRTEAPVRREEELPYRIELWDAADHTAVERVLARAVSAQLARAIFKAAQSEHPDRRVTLCRGTRIIADSAK